MPDELKQFIKPIQGTQIVTIKQTFKFLAKCLTLTFKNFLGF